MTLPDLADQWHELLRAMKADERAALAAINDLEREHPESTRRFVATLLGKLRQHTQPRRKTAP